MRKASVKPAPPQISPFTVAVVNRKGGCSKTSTCYHLSGAFAQMGYRVLLVDLDPQANLTQGFFGPVATEALPPQKTALAVFRDDLEPLPEKVIQPTPFENISIVAGASALEDFNRSQPTQAGVLQTALRMFLAEAAGQFDITLLDCPPNLQLCTWNALIAANFVLVPLQPEDFGAQGITAIQRFIDLALQTQNNQLRMLGYLVTMRQRLALHDVYENQLRSLYNSKVFNSPFPNKKDFKEAVAARKPVHFYKPKAAASKDITAIAEEMLARVPQALSLPPEFLHIENRLGVGGEPATNTDITLTTDTLEVA
ncbi:ParA family protein [bacterium]|nr:ParA family protein [bacterium]